MKMTGKTVVITGASRGIGEAAAREFAEQGANVVLLARGADRIAEIAAEIGPNAQAIPCDVASFESVQSAIERTLSQFGGIDVLVNNAGVIAPMAPLAEADVDQWGLAVDVNLKGVFHGARAVLPGMISKGCGTILNISSGAAHNPYQSWSAYCASKAGAYMLTRHIDLESGRRYPRIGVVAWHSGDPDAAGYQILRLGSRGGTRMVGSYSTGMAR